MHQQGSLKFHKRLESGETFEFVGSLEEFKFNCPQSLKAIDVDDICIIEFSPEINADQIASNLTFIGTDSAEFNDEELENYGQFEWGEFSDFPGLIQRQVIAVEEVDKSPYQIVGIETGGKAELFARKPQYLCQFVDETFGSENLLLSHSWYSEGPGPVSWDGESAVFLIRDSIIEIIDSDWQQLASLTKVISVAQIGEILYEWLKERELITQFILFFVSPQWNSKKLNREYHESIKRLSNVQSFSAELSVEQIGELLKVIRKSGRSESKILGILEDPVDSHADLLVKLLENLEIQNSEDELISFEDLPGLIPG